MRPSDVLTPEEWREAFRRLCIIADWPSALTRPSAVGDDGKDWCSEYELFDPVASAQTILDNDVLESWNEGASDWIMDRLLGGKPITPPSSSLPHPHPNPKSPDRPGSEQA